MSSLLNFSSLTADTTIYYILYFIYLLLICKDGERTLDDKWAVRLPINLCTEIPSKPRFLESSKTFDETFIHLLARRFSLRFAGWTRIGRNRTLGSSKRNLISLSFDSTSSPTSSPISRAKSYMWVIGRWFRIGSYALLYASILPR